VNSKRKILRSVLKQYGDMIDLDRAKLVRFDSHLLISEIAIWHTVWYRTSEGIILHEIEIVGESQYELERASGRNFERLEGCDDLWSRFLDFNN